MSGNQMKKRRPDLKVVILGTKFVGKTTLINRYIHGNLRDTESTVGASFYLKQWGPHNIALWDTAGEEKFTGLSSFYTRGAGAAILAFDIGSEESFHDLQSRFVPLLQSADENCMCVVVGTKLDLVREFGRKVTQEEGLRLAKELNTDQLIELPYFETSSVTGQNIDKVFEHIFEYLLPLKSGERRYVKNTVPGTVCLEQSENNQGHMPEALAAKSKCC